MSETSKAIAIIQDSMGVNTEPDDSRYKHKFFVRSASSNALYKISYDSAPGAMHWKCSCRGNIRHGDCKHLKACGLKGRKFGKVLLEDSINR